MLKTGKSTNPADRRGGERARGNRYHPSYTTRGVRGERVTESRHQAVAWTTAVDPKLHYECEEYRGEREVLRSMYT